jgi:hypothetical protein
MKSSGSGSKITAGAKAGIKDLMKLRDYTLEKLAEMVVGDAAHFPYRSAPT